MTKPLVSVIIPSFNSALFLDRCLASIKKQTYKNIEIILIDKGSSDKTQEIARKYTKNVFTLGPERSAQINYGVTKAKGKYMYRVDSDFVLEPTVIEECVEKCEKEKLDGIAIHNTSAEGLSFWAEVRKYERNSYIDDRLIVAVRFFTKTAFEKINGFDETLYGPEDYDFHNRFVNAGFYWGRIKAIERHLGEPKTIGDIWKKHFFYGKQMPAYFKKHPKTATRQFIPFRMSYIRHLSVFVKNPKIFAGLLVMTVVKFSAGGLGFVIAEITGYDPVKEYSTERKTKNLYAGLGWPTIFTSIRFWTGSLVQIEKYIPKSGKILDLGCGYGIMANYIALSSPQRDVIGVETDGRKIKYADRGVPQTKFIKGDATKSHLKNLDTILILDVLHHLDSYDQGEKLIKDCRAMLKNGGKLIIFEVDNHALWKWSMGRIIDFVLYLSKPKIYYRYRKDMIKLLQTYFKEKNIDVIKPDNCPFSQLLYVCKKE